MRFDRLAVVWSNFDVDADDASMVHRLAQARVVNETAAVGHAGFDDYVGTHCVDQFLEPDHIFRQLDERTSEPGETVDVSVERARAQPKTGTDLEAMGLVEWVVARESVFLDANRASTRPRHSRSFPRF